jgi:hypothetical protein
VTKLLERLRDELVRRDYAATIIRSHVQIVEASPARGCVPRLDHASPVPTLPPVPPRGATARRRYGRHTDLCATVLL